MVCILQIADIEDKQACFENGFTAEMFTMGINCIKLIVTGQSMQLKNNEQRHHGLKDDEDDTD